MKRFLPLLAITLLSLASSALAADAKIPSLIGTWSGSHNAAHLERTGRGAVNLVITAQDNEAFRGTMTWKATDNAKASGTEQIAGVVDFDNKTVAIVQSKGGGVIWGTLKGKNTLEVVFAQASESNGQKTLAYRSVLTRIVK